MKKFDEVLATRRGQTTIPNRIGKILNIREGTRLKVETKGDKVIFTKMPSIFDLAGKCILSKKEAFRLLGAMREERIEECSSTRATFGLYLLKKILSI